MSARGWWWVGLVIDLILLLPAFYMAMGAADIAIRSEGSPTAVGVATLFFALPVFCILAPLAAWRAHMRARSARQIIVLFATPWVYAGFLVIFLFSGNA
ncbi:MAG: hypothetical protein QOF03_818 [Alphaproteobacteria bacterium]|jgi:ABC-type protease/lipase transport system fused ATPase/permease subunit|nr:hypothetical protein [Alphaproteobacteria bacterium]